MGLNSNMMEIWILKVTWTFWEVVLPFLALSRLSSSKAPSKNFFMEPFFGLVRALQNSLRVAMPPLALLKPSLAFSLLVCSVGGFTSSVRV